MIRDGKSSWLTLDPASLPAWATLNGIKLSNVDVSSGLSGWLPGSVQQSSSSEAATKGAGLVATKGLDNSDEALVTVPREMVLSEQRVRELASGDPRLAEILRACAPFAIVCTFLSLMIYHTKAVVDIIADAAYHDSHFSALSILSRK